MLRAVETFKSKRASQGSSPLSTEKLADAECRWIEDSQVTLNCEDSFDSLRLQLNLFLDENGLWRCGGRLANANLPYSTKYPLLLPRNHPLTPLIVNDAHRRVLHNGVCETLTEVRRKFWIVKGRSLVRGIIHRCVTCRRFEGSPFPTPPPPPIPASRVQDDPAFSYTGVDFAGPLLIRTDWQGLNLFVYLLCYKSCAPRHCSGHVYGDIHSLCEEVCSSKRIAPKIHL